MDPGILCQERLLSWDQVLFLGEGGSPGEQGHHRPGDTELLALFGKSF